MPKQIWCCSECKAERVYGDAPVEDKNVVVYLLCEGTCDPEQHTLHTYDRTDYNTQPLKGAKRNEEVQGTAKS